MEVKLGKSFESLVRQRGKDEKLDANKNGLTEHNHIVSLRRRSAADMVYNSLK